jgi:two-component system OmpR family response regulator
MHHGCWLMAKVLIAEDDLSMRRSLEDVLKLDNYTVDMVTDGLEALDRLKLYGYDLAIIDWNLPGLTGIEICRRYRAQGGIIPILMLTGKKEVIDTEAGLDSGADDYLCKPFEPRVLRARLRALLRRPQQFAKELSFAKLTLNPGNLTMAIDSNVTDLLPKEFALLEYLVRHPEQVLATDTLLSHVWPSESDSGIEALRTCIKRLRRKIEVPESGCAIRTIYGIGYQLVGAKPSPE